MESPGNQRGMALLVTLSVVTLLVAGGLELNRRVRLSVEAAAFARDRLTLSEMATAGVHAAMAMLIKDKGETAIDSIQEDWARPEKIAEVVAEMPFDGGRLNVAIRDELGKIQVNALVDFPDATRFDRLQKEMWEQFMPLVLDQLRKQLEEIDGPELPEDTTPTAIIQSIGNWLDKDDEQTDGEIFDSESNYYQNLDPPYTPNNGPFVHIGELARVRGITPELFYGIGGKTGGLADSVTVHGMSRANRKVERRNYTFEGKININTAELPVLTALILQKNPEYVGSSLEFANSILDYRNETEDGEFIHDLTSPTWYKSAPDLPGDLAIDPNLITLSSDVFRIVSSAERNGVRQTLEAVVVREQAKSGKWTCNVLNWQVN